MLLVTCLSISTGDGAFVGHGEVKPVLFEHRPIAFLLLFLHGGVEPQAALPDFLADLFEHDDDGVEEIEVVEAGFGRPGFNSDLFDVGCELGGLFLEFFDFHGQFLKKAIYLVLQGPLFGAEDLFFLTLDILQLAKLVAG